MNDHTYTDKTLQGNNKIESAIAALQQEPSQEMLAHVLTVIRRRMNEHGELIIAVDPSSAASGLQIQAIQTDDGRKWWAAFTSFDEELKGSGSVMSTFLTDMYQLKNIGSKKLRQYMLNYLAIMMTVSSILCIRSKNKENLEKKKELWQYLKKKDLRSFIKIRYGILGQTMNIPGKSGRKISSLAYTVARRLIGFN